MVSGPDAAAIDGVVMSAQSLSKAYGGRVVLEVDEFELRRGEILAVMGPSGSGKTTLLRLLATLEAPAAGRVRFGDAVWPDGASAASLLAWRRRVGFVSQSPVLFSGTVGENVALGLGLRGSRGGIPSDAATGAAGCQDAPVRAILDRVGLASLASARAGALSAGEVQRAALARALVTRPEVLLLDEPTANLDPFNVGIIERALADAVASWGPAVLLITHNLFQARRIAHRTAFLVSGKLVEVGETHQIFERPVDPRTAAFVRGEMVF